MIDKINYYRVLQVQPTADEEIITAVYRKLCKKYHPDINKSSMALEKIKDINLAYSILSDSEKRRQYDLSLNMDADPEVTSKTAAGLKKAMDCLNQYFSCLMNRSYMEAYGNICIEERSNINLQDFMDWQNAVASSFRIIAVQIRDYKTVHRLKVNGYSFARAFMFRIAIEELDIKGKRNEIVEIERYVVFSNNSWHIFLGFNCLKEETEKLLGYIHGDGLTDSGRMFAQKLDEEIYRSMRYRRPLSIGMLNVLFQNPANEKLLSDIVKEAKRYLRESDEISLWGSRKIVVIFPDTYITGASAALENLEKDILSILADNENGYIKNEHRNIKYENGNIKNEHSNIKNECGNIKIEKEALQIRDNITAGEAIGILEDKLTEKLSQNK